MQLLAALFLVLCGTLRAESPARLHVRAVFSGAPVDPDVPAYTNAAGEILSFSRISFLLTDIALRTEGGSWISASSTHWMDPLNGRNETPLPSFLTNGVTAIRFFVGLDAERNNRMTEGMRPDDPLNPLLNGLHWSWQGGYVFLALEGLFHSRTGPVSGWSYHLAREPNRVVVEIPIEPAQRPGGRIDLEFDLARFFADPNRLSLAHDGAITHSRDGDPVAARLAANLTHAFRAVQRPPDLAEDTARTPVAINRDLPARWTPYPFRMPAIFPLPALPADNPLIVERVALGERLFNDPLLSRDGRISCASCHQPEHGFSDPARVSTGINGQQGDRQSMPLHLLAWKSHFFWDGRANGLREQIREPIEDPAEMGETMTNVSVKLASDDAYRADFARAFADDEPTPDRIIRALESFLLVHTDTDSRFDLALRGGAPLSDEEKRGFELFMTEFDPRTGQRGADCFHCHGLPLFTDLQFHNNGLDADPVDRGRERVTGRIADRGRFITPSLRRISATAPYMHDGRFQTLEEVVRHYSEGVHRSPSLDPNLAKHPVAGLQLSEEDQRALVAFLRSI